MDRYQCEKCNGEFYLKTRCSSCTPLPPGPYFCPECGGTLHKVSVTCIISTHEWEVD
jgi:hypothetical protein